MIRLLFTLLCVSFACATGCQSRVTTQQVATADTSQPPDHPPKQIYAGRGVVLELVPEDRGAFIHHEAIPGFMDEMTMYLKVADKENFRDLKVGHQYTFEMLVAEEEDTQIQHLVATGKVTPQNRDATAPSERWQEPLTMELGDKVPDFIFTSSTGATITPASLRGKVWAITFVFTRCPLPDYCPRMTLRLKETMEILGKKQVDNWKLISLSIDPEYDDPEILESYRQMWEVSSKDWDFCRADLEQVKQIGDPLGLTFETAKFPIEHNLRTAVFDSEGRLLEVFSGNQWNAEELAESMIRGMQKVRPESR